MNLLVTGGAGFIGGNFIRYMLDRHPDDRILNLDLLTYAGNLESLEDISSHPRYSFHKGDICDRELLRGLIGRHHVDAIVNFAAESHVDRSILGASEFIRTNITGTHCLLEAAMELGVRRFLQVSTDEVYGSLGPQGRFTESTALHPNSPYSASKASADLLALAYYRTFGFPVVVSRCSNNYGPYQFPEKLIPLMVVNALSGRKLPVYGDGKNVRDWLHVLDHCSALDVILRKGRPGDVYNIGGSNERENIDLVKRILRILGKPDSLISFVKDRQGHDRRYAIDSGKLQTELEWRPERPFEAGLEETVEWYAKNQDWWKRVMNGEYVEYYKRAYEER